MYHYWKHQSMYQGKPMIIILFLSLEGKVSLMQTLFLKECLLHNKTKRRIDVDQYTITVSAGKEGMHMNSIHGSAKWNQKWMEWINNNPNATAKDIYQFAGKMMDEYGLSGFKIHPYGQGGY
ncbi:MAG: DUF2380 domain-containing protein [Lachnospiraceae bacterium]|nr:DUF2380 domain-containing protein [Lachnospiraceae bacterium]